MDIEFLFKKATPQSETEEFWKQELNAYFYSERASKGEILLEWWKRNEVNYPHISKMARDLLSITATSVPSERLFSKAGLVVTELRNRPNAESARSLLCLNSWYTCRYVKR